MAEQANAATRRRVLVTGGRRGIGRGIAYAFAEAGSDVVVNDLVDDEAVRETLAGIAGRGGRGAFVQADAAAVAGHERLLDQASAPFGGIDVLVNNAGVSVERRGDMLEVTISARRSFSRRRSPSAGSRRPRTTARRGGRSSRYRRSTWRS
jgi:NAD(P)-dependent dehydrogenase (short-subunit alcohol dehydrogenase family)